MMDYTLDEQYHTKLGAHSNFPLCCVAAWIADDLPSLNGLSFRSRGYRPCHECYRDNVKVDIHRCTVDCIGFLKSIGSSERVIENLEGRKENGKHRKTRQKYKESKNVKAFI